MSKTGANVRSIAWDEIDDGALTGAGEVLRTSKFWQRSWFLGTIFCATLLLSVALAILNYQIRTTQQAILHIQHFSSEISYLDNVDASTKLAMILKEKVGIQRYESSIRQANRSVAADIGTDWTAVRREALVPNVDENLIRRTKLSADKGSKQLVRDLKNLERANASVIAGILFTLFSSFLISLSALRRGSTTLVVQHLERGFHDRKEPANSLDRKKSATILHNMPVALFEFESDGRILRWNQEMERLTGLSSDLAMRRGVIEGIGWVNAKEMARSTIRRLFTGEHCDEVEWAYRTPSGELLKLSATFSVIYDGGGSIRSAVGIVRDITDEKQQKELFVANDMARSAILKSLPDTILKLNSDSELIEIHDNGAFFSELNSVCAGEGWKSALSTELVQRILEGIKQTKITHKPYIFEYAGRIGSKDVAVEMRVTGSGQTDALVVITDLSDRHRALQAEENSERRFQELINGSADAILILDAKGVILYASPAFSTMLGCEADSVHGSNWVDLALPSDQVDAQIAMEELVRVPDSTGRFVVKFAGADGLHKAVEINGRNLLTNECVRSIVFNLRDITDRRRLESELEHKLVELETRNEQLRMTSKLDALTGTLNHKAVLEYLEAICEYAENGGTFSVAFVDVDNFKEFNMTEGFESGDELLISLAQVIQGACREEDICGRLGSEEFLMILPEANAIDSLAIGERIQQKFHAVQPDMTLSIGLITVSEEKTDATTLLNRLAMQMAKAHDRGPGTVYHSEAA